MHHRFYFRVPYIMPQTLKVYNSVQNALMREQNARDRSLLLDAFPQLQSCTTPNFLAFRSYLHSRPQRFFNEADFESLFSWLVSRASTHGPELKDYLKEHDGEINRALLFLSELNREEWTDLKLDSANEFELFRFVDKYFHSGYLRLIEAVLAPIARIVAHFSRLDRGKGTDGLDIYSIAEELSGTSQESFIRAYRNTVRNGIGHGGIVFRQSEISYRDKKGNEESLSVTSFVRLVDDLLDTCNGMVAALKMFFRVCESQGFVPPRQLLVEELKEETSAPWWSIEGCVESEISGCSQLIIYAKPMTRHYSKVRFSAIQTGILAEFFAPGYQRYFLSLSSRISAGWAAFDGTKLRELRESDTGDIAGYSGIVEDDLVFYVPRPAMPAFLGKLDTLMRAFRIQIPIALEKLREERGIPDVICRDSKIHRNSWGSVVSGNVVVKTCEEADLREVIGLQKRRILKVAVKHARKQHRDCLASYLPIAFAQISVYRRDYRRRRLNGFGLGEDLICTIRLHRLRRIRSPDISGATVEVDGNWRVAWNKNWLATVQQSAEDTLGDQSI